MTSVAVHELAALVEQLQAQLADLSKRFEARHPAPAAVPHASATAAPEPDAGPAITEEELLAISAAVAAYLGVRPHIHQIRLLSTTAWAQQGRVSIQASHRLQG